MAVENDKVAALKRRRRGILHHTLIAVKRIFENILNLLTHTDAVTVAYRAATTGGGKPSRADDQRLTTQEREESNPRRWIWNPRFYH